MGCILPLTSVYPPSLASTTLLFPELCCSLNSLEGDASKPLRLLECSLPNHPLAQSLTSF